MQYLQLFQRNGNRILPQLFQAVELACRLQKDMNECKAVIQQNPACRVVSLYVMRHHLIIGLELKLYFVCERLDLCGAGCAANNKVLCDRSQIRYLEHLNIFAALAVHGVDHGLDIISCRIRHTL